MKKSIALLLAALSLCLLLAACQKEENIVITAVIDEVYENGLLVTTVGDVGFDKASVHFDKDMEELDFVPTAGQTVRLTILPEIAESYPVQVRAVKIELVEDVPLPID